MVTTALLLALLVGLLALAALAVLTFDGGPVRRAPARVEVRRPRAHAQPSRAPRHHGCR